MITIDKDSNIIEKDIHCPYCNSDNALLINRADSKKLSFQLPAFGLRYVLCLLYLSFPYIWIHGYKLIEINRKTDNITYGFCPNCGNGYSMAPPEVVKSETEEPKLYKEKNGKVVMGLCKGISQYAGIPLLWVRILTVIYGFTFIGALLYFFIGACIPFKDEAEDTSKKLYRYKKGGDLLGLCKGFSEYTGIPVMWVRIFTIVGGITIFGAIMYFLLSAFIPLKENVEQGIQKKKWHKIKDRKVIFGLCTGFSEFTGMPLWAARLIIAILTIITAGMIYLIFSAIIPTEEH